MITELVRELAAFYLIATLAATSLAKLRQWRSSSIELIREAVIPSGIASLVIIAVAATEFALSTLVMLGVKPIMVGSAAALLFLAFGAYRLIVAGTTKAVPCTCAGVAHSIPARPQTVIAAILTSIFQASLACAWAFAGSHGYVLNTQLIAVAIWLAPFAVLIAGSRFRSAAADRASRPCRRRRARAEPARSAAGPPASML